MKPFTLRVIVGIVILVVILGMFLSSGPSGSEPGTKLKEGLIYEQFSGNLGFQDLIDTETGQSKTQLNLVVGYTFFNPTREISSKQTSFAAPPTTGNIDFSSTTNTKWDSVKDFSPNFAQRKASIRFWLPPGERHSWLFSLGGFPQQSNPVYDCEKMHWSLRVPIRELMLGEQPGSVNFTIFSHGTKTVTQIVDTNVPPTTVKENVNTSLAPWLVSYPRALRGNVSFVQWRFGESDKIPGELTINFTPSVKPVCPPGALSLNS